MLTSQNTSRAATASPNSEVLGEVRWYDESTDQFGEIAIYHSQCTIGCDPQCTVAIPSKGLADLHASLVFGKRFILLKAHCPIQQFGQNAGRNVKEALIDKWTRFTIGTVQIEVLPKSEVGKRSRHPKVIRSCDLAEHANAMSRTTSSKGLEHDTPPVAETVQPVAAPTQGTDLTEERLVAIETTLCKLQTAVETIQSQPQDSTVPEPIDFTQQIAAMGRSVALELDQRLSAMLESQSASQAALVGQIRDEALRPLESTIEGLVARIDDLATQSMQSSDRLDALVFSTESQFSEWNQWRNGLLPIPEQVEEVGYDQLAPPAYDSDNDAQPRYSAYDQWEAESIGSSYAENDSYSPQGNFASEGVESYEFDSPSQQANSWNEPPGANSEVWGETYTNPSAQAYVPDQEDFTQARYEHNSFDATPEIDHNSDDYRSEYAPSDSLYVESAQRYESDETNNATALPYLAETPGYEAPTAYGDSGAYEEPRVNPYLNDVGVPYASNDINGISSGDDEKESGEEIASPLAAYLRSPLAYDSDGLGQNASEVQPSQPPSLLQAFLDSASYNSASNQSNSTYQEKADINLLFKANRNTPAGVAYPESDWKDEESYQEPTSELSIRLKQMLAEIKASDSKPRGSDTESYVGSQSTNGISSYNGEFSETAEQIETEEHTVAPSWPEAASSLIHRRTKELFELQPLEQHQIEAHDYEPQDEPTFDEQQIYSSGEDATLAEPLSFDWNNGSLFESRSDALSDAQPDEETIGEDPITDETSYTDASYEEPSYEEPSYEEVNPQQAMETHAPIAYDVSPNSASEDRAIPEDREESIEEYMQKLLQRVKQGADSPEPSIEDVAIKPAPRSRGEFLNRAAKQAELDNPTPINLGETKETSSEAARRSANPAVDMNALRELANSNARRAIARSETKRASTTILIKVAITSFAVAAGALILLLNGVNTKPPFAGFIAAMIVAFLWGSDCYKHFRDLKKRKSEKPVTPEPEVAEQTAVRTGDDADGWRPSPI